MKLKAQQVYDATLVVAQIIREGRPLPLKGGYRLARMHAKLLAEFTPINDRREALIKAYEYRPSALSDQFSVPPFKMGEFTAAWGEIAGEEIDIDVEPIPLALLDLGDAVAASIHASELVTLGELVRE